MSTVKPFSSLLSCTPCRGQQHGFTLIESLVSAVLLVIGATAAFTLFTTSQEIFRQSRLKDSDQVAISEDLARVERLNRRFTCIQGNCELMPNSASDPNELQYTPAYEPIGQYPPSQAFNDKMTIFTGLCSTSAGTASGLATGFIAAAATELGPMGGGLDRVFDVSAAAQETPPTPHAYDVIYRRNNVVVRRARLVPTVAAWCP